MTDLAVLLQASRDALTEFETLLAERFPSADKWTWYRARSAMRHENTRRNVDTSRDAALATDEDLKAAHDEYIARLHAFYRARDGEHGFLGRYEQKGAA